MTSNPNKRDLSSLPTEILDKIVYWVRHLPPIRHENEFRRMIAVYNEGEDHYEGRYIYDSESEVARKLRILPFKDTRSLSSVNRSYYQRCRPYLYGVLDFQHSTADRMKLTLEQIIPRHLYYIKKISFRVPESEIRKSEAIWDANPYDDGKWDPQFKSRYEVLLEILKSCPHLLELDIDLDMEHFRPTRRLQTLENQMPDFSIQPISQLTSLTHLSLSSPVTRNRYTETFLVDIISNLEQLQSFTCSLIKATHPKRLDNQKDQQPCQSPLGLHLASLTHLIGLSLGGAECVDASWIQLDWKSSLHTLALEYCGERSLSVLYGIIKPFESTLTTLRLANGPNVDGSDQFPVELSKLSNLEVAGDHYIRILRDLQPSKSISSISFGDTPSDMFQDVEPLIREQPWPNLKKVQITDQCTSLSCKDIDDLRILCQDHGIEFDCNAQGYDDYVYDDYEHFGY